MKNLIMTSAMLAALVSPVAATADDLEGMWRGKLEIQNGIFLTIGYTIENGVLTLDSPNQGMFGKAPTTFSIEGESLEFTDAQLSATFAGEVSDGVLVGTFTQGKAFPLTLHRLDDDALERLEFEGRYAGELVLNRRTQLPLQINVAVLHEGYYVTLDSPAQQSFGIPITDFSINSETLSFSSPMISASYSGTWTEDGYSGQFLQGQARALTLKKVEEGAPQASVPK